MHIRFFCQLIHVAHPDIYRVRSGLTLMHNSSVYNLIFIGQIACPDFSSGESRMVYNHPSV